MTLANSQGQGQGHAHFYCERLVDDDMLGKYVTISILYSHIYGLSVGFSWHVTFGLGQCQGHAILMMATGRANI